MKRRGWISWVVPIAMVVSGCSNGSSGKSPTSPAPPKVDLTGQWTGAITFVAGNNCDGSQNISVSLTQTGDPTDANFSGQFDLACAGPVEIHGIISSGNLFGAVKGSIGGRILGSATSNTISMRVVQSSSAADGEGGASNQTLSRWSLTRS